MKKNKKMLLLSILLICMCIIAPTTVEAAPKISSKKVTMYVGNTKKLKVSGTKSKIKWSSSNKKIATVNSKGKILAKQAGKVKINAKVANKTLKCSITVKNPYLNYENLTLKTGETMQLNITGTKAKNWESSDINIVTVSDTGCVTCVRKGSATVTCTGANKKTYKCSITVSEPECKHTYNKTVTKQPTCENDGTAEYTCSLCGDSYTEQIEKTDHSYAKSVVKPTCTEKGYDLYTCDKCQKSYRENYTDETGHSYAKTVVKPTCTEKGYDLYTCDKCQKSYKENYTDETGHDYVKNVTKQPACENDGTAEYTCSMCGDSYTEQIEKTGHSYAKTVVKPTCKEKGYDLYTCANCQKSYKEKYTDIIGHDYVKSVVEPTCEEDGTTTYTCSMCGDSQTEQIEKTGHSYAKTVVNPTCIEKGYDLYTCANCQKSYKEKYTDTIEHDYVKSVVEPTCEKDGTAKYTCSMCGDSYTEQIEKTGHSYIKTVVNPTCTEKGYDLYTCEKCQTNFKDNYVDATGHAWEYEGIVQESTCTEQGIGQYICTTCLMTYKEYLPLKDHAYHINDIPGAIAEEATCTQYAVYYYSCDMCKMINEDMKGYNGTLKDHTYGESFKIIEFPNYTEEGLKEESCIYCGITRESIIPRNDYVTGVKVLDPSKLDEELSPKTTCYLSGLTKGITEKFYICFDEDKQLENYGHPIGVNVCYSSDEKEVINSDGKPMTVNIGDIVFQIDDDDTLYGVHIEDIKGLTTVYEDKLYLYIPELCEVLTNFGWQVTDIKGDIVSLY